MKHPLRSTAFAGAATLVILLAALPGRADPSRRGAGDDLPLSDASALMRAVAARYTQWSRVDDELRWAPWLCRMPMPSRARISAAAARSPHGRKLYFVYARHRDEYVAVTSSRLGSRAGVTVGQVVVKEAFVPRRMTSDELIVGVDVHPDLTDRRIGGGTSSFRTARSGDAHFGPGAAAGIYVVAKVGRAIRDTDRGWIYGTVTPDGRVTSTGRVASCVSCHADAPHERLFGLGGGH